MLLGYLHPQYTQSLAEFGVPRHLARSGAWVLERQIPGFDHLDAMGCYPLFFSRDWSQLHLDLAELQDSLVTLFAVTEPFGDYREDQLRQTFDIVFPYKGHYVSDLRIPRERLVTKHHRYYARKVSEKVFVDHCENPSSFFEEWTILYDNLIQRHHLKGIKAFSRAAFKQQLSIPGMVVFRASYQGAVVGAHLWFQQGVVAYSHLAAFSPLGYQLMASYALYWYDLEHFADKVHWIDLGAGAGIVSQSVDGLSQFKRGWSSGQRNVYFCGRIFDRSKYDRLVDAKGIPSTSYFPAYRSGEFG